MVQLNPPINFYDQDRPDEEIHQAHYQHEIITTQGMATIKEIDARAYDSR